MKPFPLILIFILLLGCLVFLQPPSDSAQIAATTLPVYEFTSRICEGTGLTVTRLVTESVSCLHDYSLNVRQVRAAEAAELIVINGAGLEDFMDDLLDGQDVLDSSSSIDLLENDHHHEHHAHEESDDETHSHEVDSHIWLSIDNAKIMAGNICEGLSARYPEYADSFSGNLELLMEDFQALQDYADQQLQSLSCREIITFHDGFSYLARDWNLDILESVEEESGSEASAGELKDLIGLVHTHQLPAIFAETLGSVSAARIISEETGVSVYYLDMAMHGDSYFEAMYHNISTIKGALE